MCRLGRCKAFFVRYGIASILLIMLVTSLLMMNIDYSVETWDSFIEKRNSLESLKFIKGDNSENENLVDKEADYQFERRRENLKVCPEDGSLLWVKDTKLAGPNLNLASYSTPLGLVVKKSGIKGAGVGVWTLVDLPECLIFGPITGDKVDPEEDIDRIYSWDVLGKDDEVIFVLDANDTSRSNWLRWLNCAPTEESAQLTYIQKNEKLYCRTNRMIPAGTELLVWYGEDTAKELGLLNTTTSNS